MSRNALHFNVVLLVTIFVVVGVINFVTRETRVTPEYLIIVVSATREVDYATGLLQSLRAQDPYEKRASIVLFDVDAREIPYPPNGVKLARASDEPLHVNLDTTQDKHYDSRERIRWRTKTARDMRDALTYGARSEYKHIVVLEDDVRASRNFIDRLDDLVREADARRSPWLAWVLMNAPEYDHGRPYKHGDAYVYEACTQAMMYKNGPQLKELVETFAQKWKEDPSDWIIRDHQRRTHLLMYVAIPNIAQHIGTVSSMRGKKRELGGCVSQSFTE